MLSWRTWYLAFKVPKYLHTVEKVCIYQHLNLSADRPESVSGAAILTPGGCGSHSI